METWIEEALALAFVGVTVCFTAVRALRARRRRGAGGCGSCAFQSRACSSCPEEPRLVTLPRSEAGR